MEKLERLRTNLKNSLQASNTPRADFARKAFVRYNKLSQFLEGGYVSNPTITKIRKAMREEGWLTGRSCYIQKLLPLPGPTAADLDAARNAFVGFTAAPVLPAHFTEPQEKPEFQIHCMLTKEQRRALFYFIMDGHQHEEEKQQLLDLFDL